MSKNLLIAPLIAGIVLFVGFAFLNRSPEIPAPSERPAARAVPKMNPARGLLDDWKSSRPKTADAKSLAELRQKFTALDKDAAVAEIRSFLESGVDAPTGLPFDISGDQSLGGWPTLRVFLLDLLLAINPAAAAEISRGILSLPTTADEWAVALRNVGRVENPADSRDFLREKTEVLISNPDWQAKPSVGYLNAFDVLVHTRATSSAPLLSSLVQRKDRRDLSHAAFLTLDRLVQRDTVEMLSRLKSDTALHESRPEMVAQQFARADLRDLAQRSLVRDWLLDPNRKPVELNTFAESYPNNNQMISSNLLTSEPRLSGADLGKHDREVLEFIKTWQADPAFQSISLQLQTIATRLSEFVGSAALIPPTQ